MVQARCSGTAVFLGRSCLVLLAWVAAASCATAARRPPVQHRTAYRGSVPLTIINDTRRPVCYVQMGPARRERGGDWLGRSEVIDPGAGRTFMTRGGAAWRVRVQDCRRRTVRQRTLALTSRVRLAASTLQPTTLHAILPAPQRYAGPIELTLVNDTAAHVYYVNISPSEDGNWGGDWLGEEETIAPGATRTFRVADRDAWDIRVQGRDHENVGLRRRISVPASTRLNVSALGDR